MKQYIETYFLGSISVKDLSVLYRNGLNLMNKSVSNGNFTKSCDINGNSSGDP